MVKIITTLGVLCLLCACKSDDAFVVGGGPDPDGGLETAHRNEHNRDIVATVGSNTLTNVDIATLSGLMNDTAALEDDLDRPLLYTTGDTVLIASNTVNALSTVPLPLMDATRLVRNTTDLVRLKALDNTLNDLNGDAAPLRSVDGTVNGLPGSSTDSGHLLERTSDAVGGLVNDTTETVNDVINGPVAGGGGEILGGTTGTIDSVYSGATKGSNSIDLDGSDPMPGNGDLLDTGPLAN